MKLRVGIIGAGAIVKSRHLPGLSAIPEVEVVAVCNRRHETAQAIANEFNIPEVVDSWEHMVTRTDLDVIWIGTTPHLHAPITIAALKSGKHVFCQARMAMNLKEAQEMLDVAKKHPSQVTMLCPPPHGITHGKHFQRLIREGYIGTISHLRLQALSSLFSDPTTPPHWRQQINLSGQNMLTVGIYAEVLQRWFGVPQSIQAQTRIVHKSRGGIEVKIPDTIHALVQWSEGFHGTLEWSGVSLFAPSEKLEVYGDQGTIVYDFTTDTLWGARRGEKELRPLVTPPEEVGCWQVEKDFISAIRSGGGSPEPSFETGVNYMRFTAAIHASAQTRTAIDLKDFTP